MALLTTFVPTAVNSMAAPKFSELYYRDNLDELFYIAKKSAKLIFLTTAPILACLLIFGKTILQILFGIDLLGSYEPMSLLVIGQFVSSISGSSGVFLNMTNNHNIFKNILVFSALGNILLSFIFIPKYGVMGAAFSGMLSVMSWNIMSLCYIKIKFGKTIGYFPGFNTNKKSLS